MQIAKGVLGGLLLFLGRELNWLFGGGFAALTALQLVPLLHDAWAQWVDYVFIGGLGVLVAGITIAYERAGYFLSGFFFGGYFLTSYLSPPEMRGWLLVFLIGGAISSLVIGLFTEWALMLVTSGVGAIYLADMLRLDYMTKVYIGAGLFVIGALVQAVIMRAEKHPGRER